MLSKSSDMTLRMPSDRFSKNLLTCPRISQINISNDEVLLSLDVVTVYKCFGWFDNRRCEEKMKYDAGYYQHFLKWIYYCFKLVLN